MLKRPPRRFSEHFQSIERAEIFTGGERERIVGQCRSHWPTNGLASAATSTDRGKGSHQNYGGTDEFRAAMKCHTHSTYNSSHRALAAFVPYVSRFGRNQPEPIGPQRGRPESVARYPLPHLDTASCRTRMAGRSPRATREQP